MVEILEKVCPTNFFLHSGFEKVGRANFFQNFHHFPGNLLEIKELVEKVGPTNFFPHSGSEKVGGANFFHHLLDFQEVSL